jgi:hypothetical protein
MRILWMVLFALLIAPSAQAQEAPTAPEPAAGIDARRQATELAPSTSLTERLGLTGAVRAGYWSSTKNLDAEQHIGGGMLWLKSSRRISERVSFLAEGWASLHGPFDAGDVVGELREAFVNLRFGRFDVRAGRQVIAWGRADGVNPTDNLSGQDLTLLVPDEADRRQGATAVRASYFVGDVSLTALWLPEFRGHQFALPAPPPGIVFVRDEVQWPGDQWAARVEQTGRAVDWSVSYFRGKDTAPDLSLAAAGDEPLRGPGILLSHHRVRTLGGDMAASVGRFGLRGEVAYVATDDRHGTDPFTKNPFVFLVVGTDRTWRSVLNLNVQYLFRYVQDTPERPIDASGVAAVVASQQAILNSQTRGAQHGASLRVAYKWLNETLEGELAAAGYAEPSGVTLRPKLTYALNDDWKALAGAEIFRGETASLFGFLRDNSTGYFELRWGF